MLPRNIQAGISRFSRTCLAGNLNIQTDLERHSSTADLGTKLEDCIAFMTVN